MCVASIPQRTFQGLTAGERKAERRIRLLEAALDVIGTTGWSSATMTAICGRAGLTERYFYESFKDREALYLQLIDLVAGEVEAALLVALQDAEGSPIERLRTVAMALVTALADDPRKGRVALLEGLGSEPLQRRRREIIAGFLELLQAQGAAVGLPPERRRAPSALDLVMIGGATSELLSRRLAGELQATDREIADRIAAMALWAIELAA